MGRGEVRLGEGKAQGGLLPSATGVLMHFPGKGEVSPCSRLTLNGGAQVRCV